MSSRSGKLILLTFGVGDLGKGRRRSVSGTRIKWVIEFCARMLSTFSFHSF